MPKLTLASIIICIACVLLCTFTFNRNEAANNINHFGGNTAISDSGFAYAPPVDSLVNFSLCANSGAYHLPYSIELPLAQTIRGYRNTDSLIAFLQDRFDAFSWRTFIALNWPSLPVGMPDSTACFSSNSPSIVWEHWMPSSRIYVGKGMKPSGWKDGEYNPTQYFHNSKPLLNAAKDKPGNIHPLNSGTYSNLKISKVDSQFTIFDAQQFPIVDKHHMYTLFEIFYNQEAYDYVVNSKLYSKQGQQQFSQQWPSFTKGLTMTINKDTVNIEKKFKRAYFPVGNYKDSTKSLGDTTFSFVKNDGALIIKSAWVVLTDKSDFNNYFTRTIKVKDKTDIKTRTLGLVGMHFIHKVAEVTQWVWSSFEHIHNAPAMGAHGKAVLQKGVDYLYFDERKNDSSTFNKHPVAEYQANPFSRKPTQVVKLVPSLKSTDHVNQLFHNLIAKQNKKSVWLNYRLIGTQWALNPTLFTYGSSYQPAIMANSLLETYSQKTSSCMGCHKQSRFLYNDDPKKFFPGYNADFVFGLGEAK